MSQDLEGIFFILRKIDTFNYIALKIFGMESKTTFTTKSKDNEKLGKVILLYITAQKVLFLIYNTPEKQEEKAKN